MRSRPRVSPFPLRPCVLALLCLICLSCTLYSHAQTPAHLIQINAGGGASGSFVADTDYSGGYTYSTGSAIDTTGVASPAPQSVYRTDRGVNFTYTLPGLTPGIAYTLRLHFAEDYFNSAGQRVFNVLVNGTQVLSNFDVYAAAGGEYKALVETFTATANSSGQIVVQFVNGSANNAEVNGLEVWGIPGAAPSGLAATPGNGSVSLSWTAPAGTVTGYNVYRSTTSGSGFAKVNTGAVTSTSYTDSGLTNGTAYYYVVTALSSGGESGSSNQASATPGSGGVAPVLSGLSLSPGTVIGALTNGTQSIGTVTLSSVAPSGGVVVSLASANTSLVTLPATVTVPAGSISQTFTITAGNVTSQQTVQLSAIYNGTFLSQTLTINPWLQSFQISPGNTVGGITPYPTDTITLNAAAPAGGLPVSVTSNDSSVTVPSTVTVPAGSSTTTFTPTTSAVTAGKSVTVSISYSGTSLNQYLNVQPLLSSLSLNPYSVNGGTTSTGTVTLNGPAPAGGAVITLASSNTSVATVPASVTVAAGSTSATFTVTTVTVTSVASPVITAGNAGTTVSQTLTVNPISLSVALSPTSVVGGGTATGTITLNGAAPAGGLTVTLSSSNTSAASVPTSVTVPAGQTTATFTITTTSVSSNSSCYIIATYGGLSSYAYLTVLPLLSGLSVSPSTVIGGGTATGTVSLNGPAPAGGAGVTLSSNSGSVTVPTTVLVPAGATSQTFTVTTSAVTSYVYAYLTAAYGGASRQAYVYVEPLLSSLSLNPYSVVGGTPSTGTVSLNAAAPSGGVTVTLSSNNTSVATVPTSVAVAAGSTSATFTVTTLAVSANTSAIISGAYAGVTVQQTLTVVPLLSGISVSPGTVIGGGTATGTVSLNGPAPSGGTVVTLSSGNTSVATVPASVTVAAGSTSATFTVTTSVVTASSTASLSAACGGVTRSTTLTVVPLISSVSVSPPQVVGGDPASGYVAFTVAAPSGVTLSLSSSNTAAASVPATLSVTSGSYSVPFNVTTSAVSAATTVTITASYGGVSKTATLTVYPMPTVAGVVLTPAEVTGGTGTTGRVTLSGIAPAAGAVVTLTSGNTAIGTVSATVTIASGQTQGSFSVGTTPVAATTSTTITGTYHSTSASGPLTVGRPVLTGFSFAQSPTIGGSTDLATLQLNGNAPTGGVTIALTCVTPGSGLTGAAFPASVVIPAGSTSTTVPVQTSTVNTPVTLTFTATNVVSGGESLTATVGLTVATLHAVDILPQMLLLQWNVSAVGNYLLYRNGTQIATLSNTTYSYTDAFAWASGQTYRYDLYDSNSPASPLSTEQSVPYLVPAMQDQAVDSRLDPRYATNVYVDHMFGSSAYRGGLFVGLDTDPSRVGRSFAEFNLNQSPSGGVYRVGRVNAYFTMGDPGLGSTSVIVGCQTIPNISWSAPTLTWDTAPTSAGFSPATATQTTTVTYNPAVPGALSATAASGQVSLTWTPPATGKAVASYTVEYGTYSGYYPQSVTGITGTTATVTGLTNGQAYYFVVLAVYTDGTSSGTAAPVSVTPPSGISGTPWCSWPLTNDIYAAIQGTGGNNLYSVAWASTNEAQQGWLYFAKTEYQASLGPCVTHLWSIPTLLRLQVPSPVSVSGAATGILTVNAIGLMGTAAVTLSSNNTAVATVPASITVTGLNRTFTITPHSQGTATITATLGSISLTTPITVTSP